MAAVKALFTQERLRADHPGIRIRLVDTTLAALQAVSLGQADAYVGSLGVAAYLIQKHGLNNLKVAAPGEYKDNYLSMAVRSDWPLLLGIIQKGLDAIPHQTRQAIRQEWIAVRYEHGIQKKDLIRVGLWVASAASIVLAMMLFLHFQVRRREERFRGLTEYGTDITLAFSEDGVIVYQSPSHGPMLGYREGELVGKSVFDLFHPEDLAKWSEARDSIQTEGAVHTFMHRLRRDAEPLWRYP